MATASKTSNQSVVLEIRPTAPDGQPGAMLSYNVPSGATMRVVMEAAVGIGASDYRVLAAGVITFTGEESVSVYEGQQRLIGAKRTDLILVAGGPGQGTAEIRTLNQAAQEVGMMMIRFDVANAPESL